MNINVGALAKRFFTLENTIVFGILLAAFILRVFRVDQILAFHYDQGRDALVLWDLIHEPYKLFLIGPTTGLPGVFRGPFYYYLIAPFYLLGNGNPVWPSVFLALTSVAALFILYKLAKEIGGSLTGIITLIFGSFSFEVVYASRWLSNPTPMLLLSVLLILCLFKIYDGHKKYWIFLSAILGLSFFNFGSSGELFYFPSVALFALWKRKTLDIKTITYSSAVFALTFLPLLVFNIKHDGILTQGISNLTGTETSFAIPTWRFFMDRLSLVFVYLTSVIFHNPFEKEWLHIVLIGFIFVYFLQSLLKNDKFKIVFYILLSPIVGLLFYQGNHGNLYQYYLTGYYLVFILILSVPLTKLFQVGWMGRFITVYLLFFFLSHNLSYIKPYIYAKSQEKNTIVLGTQKDAIDWVYHKANGRPFNVDVYVPPVISYSYDYLFKWLGTSRYNKLPDTSRVDLLYTIYETDPDHPERLKAWLDRQAGIGTVINEHVYGGITVQERERIKTK